MIKGKKYFFFKRCWYVSLPKRRPMEQRLLVKSLYKCENSLIYDKSWVNDFFLPANLSAINMLENDNGQKIDWFKSLYFSLVLIKSYLDGFFMWYFSVIHRENCLCFVRIPLRLFHLKTYNVIAMVKAVVSALVLVKMKIINTCRVKNSFCYIVIALIKIFTNACGNRVPGSG